MPRAVAILLISNKRGALGLLDLSGRCLVLRLGEGGADKLRAQLLHDSENATPV
jgi:hypothetical protein